MWSLSCYNRSLLVCFARAKNFRAKLSNEGHIYLREMCLKQAIRELKIENFRSHSLISYIQLYRKWKLFEVCRKLRRIAIFFIFRYVAALLSHHLRKWSHNFCRTSFWQIFFKLKLELLLVCDRCYSFNNVVMTALWTFSN